MLAISLKREYNLIDPAPMNFMKQFKLFLFKNSIYFNCLFLNELALNPLRFLVENI